MFSNDQSLGPSFLSPASCNIMGKDYTLLESCRCSTLPFLQTCFTALERNPTSSHVSWHDPSKFVFSTLVGKRGDCSLRMPHTSKLPLSTRKQLWKTNARRALDSPVIPRDVSSRCIIRSKLKEVLPFASDVQN